jgi:hypothetical protein
MPPRLAVSGEGQLARQTPTISGKESLPGGLQQWADRLNRYGRDSGTGVIYHAAAHSRRHPSTDMIIAISDQHSPVSMHHRYQMGSTAAFMVDNDLEKVAARI